MKSYNDGDSKLGKLQLRIPKINVERLRAIDRRKLATSLIIAALTITLVYGATWILWQGIAVEGKGTIKPKPAASVTVRTLDLGEIYSGNETTKETNITIRTNVQGAKATFEVNGTNLNVLESWEIRIYDDEGVLKGIIDSDNPTSKVTVDLEKGDNVFKIQYKVKAGVVDEATDFTLNLVCTVTYEEES